MMDLRRRLMMGMLPQNSVWNSKTITATQNYTTLGEVKAWLDSVIGGNEYVWVVKDVPILVGYEFLGTLYAGDKNTYHIRWANNTISPIATNNTSASEYVNANDTFTVLYQ